jgi:hypothetical protein
MNDVKIGKVFLSVAGCGTYGFVGWGVTWSPTMGLPQ